MGAIRWFNSAYKGDALLWQVFVYGFLLPIFPITIIAGIGKEILIKGGSEAVAFAIVAINFLYFAWLTIATWRCSINTRRPAFKLLARLFCLWPGLTAASIALMMLGK